MKPTQKILLACSAVCYIMTLYNIIIRSYNFILIFFVLHSILLLYFTYLSYASNQDMIHREELDSLQTKYEELSKECEQLRLQLSGTLETQRQLEETRKQMDMVQLELENEKKHAVVPCPATLLPPIANETDTEKYSDIIRIVHNTVLEFQERARNAGIQIQISSNEDTLPIKADPDRLHILLCNLIDNAVKHMKHGGVLTFTLSNVADDVFIVLKDTGEGVDEAELPHIFDINYQGSNRISGSGLGLAQVKAIVKAYNGTIYAKSTPGNGLGVYIQLPANKGV